MVSELSGAGGAPRSSCAVEDFDDEHVTLVTNRAGQQGATGEVFVVLMVILRGFVTSLVRIVRTHLQQLAAQREFLFSALDCPSSK
jgi:hypothetical protein